MTLKSEHRSFWSKTFPSFTLFSTNPTLTDLIVFRGCLFRISAWTAVIQTDEFRVFSQILQQATGRVT
jgi:hypothetical protein